MMKWVYITIILLAGVGQTFLVIQESPNAHWLKKVFWAIISPFTGLVISLPLIGLVYLCVGQFVKEKKEEVVYVKEAKEEEEVSWEVVNAVDEMLYDYDSILAAFKAWKTDDCDITFEDFIPYYFILNGDCFGETVRDIRSRVNSILHKCISPIKQGNTTLTSCIGYRMSMSGFLQTQWEQAIKKREKEVLDMQAEYGESFYDLVMWAKEGK